MKPLLNALAVFIVAVGVPAASSAGPPAPLLITTAAAHAQPVAGHTFTGLTITPVSPARISSVDCGATLRGKFIAARLERFYAQGVAGPAAVSCSWKIPHGAHGWLKTWTGASVKTSLGTHGLGAAWRIKTQ